MLIIFLSIALCSIDDLDGNYHSFSDEDDFSDSLSSFTPKSNNERAYHNEPTDQKDETSTLEHKIEPELNSFSHETDFFSCDSCTTCKYSSVVSRALQNKCTTPKYNSTPDFKESEKKTVSLKGRQDKHLQSNSGVCNATDPYEGFKESFKDYQGWLFSPNNSMRYITTGIGSSIAVLRDIKSLGPQTRPGEISEPYMFRNPNTIAHDPKYDYKIFYAEDEIYEEKPQDSVHIDIADSKDVLEIEEAVNAKYKKKRKKLATQLEIMDTIEEEDCSDEFDFSTYDLIFTENTMLDSLVEHIESIRSSFFNQNDLNNISIVIYDDNSQNNSIYSDEQSSVESSERENTSVNITPPKEDELKAKKTFEYSILPIVHKNTVSKTPTLIQSNKNIKVSNLIQDTASKNPVIYVNEEEVRFQNKVNFIFDALKYISSQMILGNPIIKSQRLQALVRRITDCTKKVKKEFMSNHSANKSSLKDEEAHLYSNLNLERIFLNRLYKRLMTKLTGKKKSVSSRLKENTEVYFYNIEPINFTLSDKTKNSKIKTRLVPNEIERMKEMERIKILARNFVSFDCFYNGKNSCKSRKRTRI
ncbi:hypothetical protein CWI37_0296p0020 [Hamiltosporidium tvaerminnensis]|uniref:Uncharacterized protein n=1 Tax=Hamiltosporidium tvaerminnensis TaxID=1176355 RepID=A0A4Q9L880_9MICR|nr:hypothetical protein LUQ84_001644 [Hamiltosporidium tvaerminnensis]TBU03425.1 hypothetical protein CWI37_0296p0020 [Hamiltosporidium tvaerminnensis]